LAELCAVHRDAIRREFAGWTQVPAEVRAAMATVTLRQQSM
jgi:hypothetical protein